jgi:hypothetical protein
MTLAEDKKVLIVILFLGNIFLAVSLHAMEALGGRGGMVPTHSRPWRYTGVSGQRHTPAILNPGERTPVPTGQEAGWAPELVWTQRLEKKWEWNLDRQSVSS